MFTEEIYKRAVLESKEEINIEDFLCDFIPEYDEITVNARWLQDVLKENNKLTNKNKALQYKQDELLNAINLLNNRIDNLNLSISISKAQQPKVIKRRYLNI